MINISVFASGSGTNFQALTDYFLERKNICINILLCNRPGAAVLDRASKANIKSFVFTRHELENSSKVLNFLVDHNTHFIVLAGFLLKIPDNILRVFPDRIINIHPALLPKYGGKGMYGMRVHEKVISSGDSFSGITIHMVNEEYDKGNIISQHTCEIKQDDTPATLAERIHQLEYYWYPRIIEKLLVSDR